LIQADFLEGVDEFDKCDESEVYGTQSGGRSIR